MKNYFVKLSASVLAAVMLVVQLPFASALFAISQSSQGGEVIVAYKSAGNTSINISGVQKSGTVSLGGEVFSLVKSSVYSQSQLKSRLSRLDNVKYVQSNTRFKLTDTDEDYQSFQWAINNSGQTGGKQNADIGASKIYDSGVKSGDKVVAIVDSGIDASQSDLKDNLWKNEYQRDLAGAYGYDFVNHDTVPDDIDGHGTHCAGIITAADDQSGVKGVNSDVKIMSLKAFEDDYGDLYDILCAYSYIYRAKELGVDIIAVNNSWGGLTDETSCEPFESVINTLGEKGIISVFAAGNDSADSYNESYDGITYKSIPLDINSDYLINVGSVNDRDEISSFSNYGGSVDVYAPGESILSNVSYACYNPGIYSENKKAQTNAQFTDFDGNSDFADTSENALGAKTLNNESASGKVTVSADGSNGFFGGSSLKWQIKGASAGDVYTLYLPYTAKYSASKAKSSYLSFMMYIDMPEVVYNEYSLDYDGVPFLLVREAKAENVSEDIDYYSDDILLGGYLTGSMDYWDHEQMSIGKSIAKGSERAVVFQVETNAAGDYTFNLDDIGISQPVTEANAESMFGKYDYYNGTSMAAPYVTGAITLLDKYFGNISAKKLVSVIKGSVRELSDEKAASKGALDLRNADNPLPYASGVSSASAAVTISGDFFGSQKGRVYINDGEIASGSITWSDSKIKADASKYVNKNVTVKIVTASGGEVTSKIFVQGKVANYSSLSTVSGWAGYTKIVSDGSNLYLLDEYGGFTKAKVSSNSVSCTELTAPDESKLFSDCIAKENIFAASGGYDDDYDDDYYDDSGYYGSENMKFTSEFVYQNGKIWGVAKYSGGYSSYYKLVSYMISTDKWAAEAQLPSDKTAINYSYSSLGMYKGKLYLMGGYNSGDDTVTDMVRIYDPSSKKWSNGASLPSGRFKSSAYQVDGKLVVMFGGDGADGMPKTAVFDGKAWTEKSVPPISFEDAKNSLSLDNNGVDDPSLHDVYYTVQAGVAKNGVAIVSGNCESLGNTYFYNLSTDKFSALSYTKSADAANILAASVGGKFVSVYSKIGLLSVKNVFSYVPIFSACYSVTRKTQNCTVTGNSQYFAGDEVTITVKPNKKCYFKALYIDGKKVKGKSYTFTASKNIKVTAVCGAYVTKVKLNKKTAKVKAGKKIKLKAKVTPKKATNKKVKWTTSNKKLATVNKKGVVKTKTGAKGKTVKIYAKATDGSKKKAVCKIKIV